MTTNTSSMQITHVQVYPILDPQTKKKAFARICINDELQLTGLTIYEGTHGLFVSYPNDPNFKGEDYKQIYYPVSSELRKHIETVILDEYEKEL